MFGSRICSSENVSLFRWHEYPPVWESLWLITRIGWDIHSRNSKPLNFSDVLTYLWIEWVEKILNSNSYTSWSKLFEWEVADFLAHFFSAAQREGQINLKQNSCLGSIFNFNGLYLIWYFLLQYIAKKTNIELIEPKNWWFVDVFSCSLWGYF